MKKLLSFILPTKAELVTAKKLPGIEVNINNGKVHIDGKNVNYSFGSLHHVFRKAIRFKSKEISKAKTALILGFGAGSIAKILWNEKNFPIQITGVDFEPLMYELAEKYSGIKDFEKLTLIEADAHVFVKECKEQFDVIFIDLFVEDQVPDFCMTLEFMKCIKRLINKDGLVIWDTLVANKLEEQMHLKAKEVGFDVVDSKQVTKDNLVFYINQLGV